MSRVTRAAGPHRAGVVLACVALALGAGLAGCGDDEEEGTPTTTPTIEPATPTGPTGAAGEQGAGPEGKKPAEHGDVALDDGTVTPPPESDSQISGGAAAPEDSAENDRPPDPGSAEEEFEKFCDDNPGAC